MNGKNGGDRSPRRAAALVVTAAVAVLTTGCGLVHVHLGSSGGSAPAGPATYRARLAYAQCMRTHGLPGFPDPGPSGGPSVHVNVNPDSPAARANDACKHLLAADSAGTASATAPASSPPGAVIREVLIPSSYTVADVARSIHQDTRRRDRGTGQLEAGSRTDTLATPLTPWQGLGVLALWAAGALTVGALVLRWHDV